LADCLNRAFADAVRRQIGCSNGMRSSVIVYGIAYRTFKELSRKSAYNTTIAHTICRGDEWGRFARFRLNLSQGGAAHFIDGASGKLAGDCLYTARPGWSTGGDH
jgi:hypothetical protein